jgi:hypothetical protein
MRKRTTSLVLAGVLAAGAVGAVVITPASATTSTNPVTSRLAGIKGALSGLVGDGTLTQAQADKVASTLDKKLPKRGERAMGRPGGRFGGMGMGMAQSEDAAAKALGLTPDKLRVALQGGKSLAAVAKDQKVSVDLLVKAMVSATEAELATAVKEGRLTQAQADKMKTSLSKRITDRVNSVRPGRGMGHSPRGAGKSSGTGGVSGGMGGPMSSPSTVS